MATHYVTSSAGIKNRALGKGDAEPPVAADVAVAHPDGPPHW
ncbi:hypothetical protein [Streptomyces sp. NPDC005485]